MAPRIATFHGIIISCIIFSGINVCDVHIYQVYYVLGVCVICIVLMSVGEHMGAGT